jgi:vacuolar-type H+-ATPase subunit I/STV1
MTSYMPIIQLVLSGLSLFIIPLIAAWWQAMRKESAVRDKQLSVQMAEFTASIKTITASVEKLKDEQHQFQTKALEKELEIERRYLNTGDKEDIAGRFRELKQILEQYVLHQKSEFDKMNCRIDKKADK